MRRNFTYISTNKRRVNFILNIKTTKKLTKELRKRILIISVFAVVIILVGLIISFKPVYKVTISGEVVGYISNKNKFNKKIEDEILNKKEGNIAFVDLAAEPEYEFNIVGKNEKTSEEEIFNNIKDNSTITYKLYAITLNNENTTFVNSFEEAEEAIAQIKENDEENLEEIEIGMQEVYTTNIEEAENTLELESAIDETEIRVAEIVEENERIKAATFDGVYFAVKPVTGNITSRYGATEDIRSHAHSGLDITAPAGTDIVAAADGTVTFTGTQGGYGNLVIITHENGVQSYYGHCSKIYASEGDEVKAGDLIAAVGMTGFATGNHLHFEIRKNGSTVNPQKYIYN